MTHMRATALPALPRLLLGGLATLGRRTPIVPPEPSFAARFTVADIDTAHVARYRKAIGFRGDHVPLTYFYLLAQWAQLALMMDRRFPYPLAGLIHRGNDLHLHALLQTGALDIDVAVKFLHALDGVPKIAFDVGISQAGRLVVSCASEYRIPARKRHKPVGQTGPDQFPESFAQIDWSIDPAAIRRYARVSGDYNPIHLSALLARLFGCKGAIAHGMYSVGRAAAHIERQTARPLTAISADFRRPILLPAQLLFGLESADASCGCYGVLLKEPKMLALSGSWET